MYKDKELLHHRQEDECLLISLWAYINIIYTDSTYLKKVIKLTLANTTINFLNF